MTYKVYSAEYKIAAITEFQSRQITIRDFAKEKDINFSTFSSWILKARKYGQPSQKQISKNEITSLMPIEVTTEAKEIIKEEANKKVSKTFIMEVKGIKLTFSISNIKEVLEAINNG